MYVVLCCVCVVLVLPSYFIFSAGWFSLATPLGGGGSPPAGSNLITDFDLHIYNDSGKNAPCYLSLPLSTLSLPLSTLSLTWIFCFGILTIFCTFSGLLYSISPVFAFNKLLNCNCLSAISYCNYFL